MTLEEMEDLADRLATHSVETADIEDLMAMYYDERLAFYGDMTEDELVTELNDRGLDFDDSKSHYDLKD